jgi:hypothetical protein
MCTVCNIVRHWTPGDEDQRMARSVRPEDPAHFEELAKLALWEADRTLDQEAAQSMRALADRFKLRSQRSQER